MTITLLPEHERLIADALKTGAYQNAEDVIGRALQMLHFEDEWLQENSADVESKIDRALNQFETGEFFSAEESRAHMEKRKAEWVSQRVDDAL